MAPSDPKGLRHLLGDVSASLSDRELEWLARETANVEALSRGLAEFPKEEWDFAAIALPRKA